MFWISLFLCELTLPYIKMVIKYWVLDSVFYGHFYEQVYQTAYLGSGYFYKGMNIFNDNNLENNFNMQRIVRKTNICNKQLGLQHTLICNRALLMRMLVLYLFGPYDSLCYP